MEKIKKYIPRIILLDTIIYTLIIVTLYLILSFCKLMFIEIIQKLFLHKIRILPAGFSACGGSFLRHLSSPFRSDIVALLQKEKLNL